ncbi:MAG: UDP-N-acetylmuramate--alanine ligase, partial [Vulcanococcus sp.]
QADAVLIAPLYAAGEAPIPGISSAALAAEIQHIAPGLPVSAFDELETLADAIGQTSQAGDLVLAMGAGDVNSLWSRLEGRSDPAAALPLVA